MLMRGRNQPQIERYRILQVSSCKIRISFPCAFLADLASSSLGLPVTRREKIIQTEAERRRREAGVKQSMEIRLGSCMWVCGWVGVYGIWNYLATTKARSAINEVPNYRSPERALLRHHIIGVRLPTSARRAKLPK